MLAWLDATITAFVALFAFGTMGFWILLFIASSILIAFIENEKEGFATFFAIVTFLFLASASELSLNWVMENPIRFALYCLGYLAIGATWTIFKWWRFTHKMRERYDLMKKRFLSNKNMPHDVVIPESLRLEWKKYVQDYTDLRVNSTGIVPPDPKNHLEQIYTWIVFWPWSLLWYTLDEPVKKIANAVFKSIRRILEQISLSAFKSTEQDF